MSRLSAQMTGNWAGVSKLLASLPQHILDKVEQNVRQLAQDYLAKLRENIEMQDLNVERLSDRYLSRKIAQGLDKRILIATGEYLSKLRLEETGKGKDYQVFVGAFESDIHEHSGLTMAKLAEYLEDGTPRMPARPHIQPTWDKMKMDAAKCIAAQLARAISDSVRGV